MRDGRSRRRSWRPLCVERVTRSAGEDLGVSHDSLMILPQRIWYFHRRGNA
jgi:hypothetical protein